VGTALLPRVQCVPPGGLPWCSADTRPRLDAGRCSRSPTRPHALQDHHLGRGRPATVLAGVLDDVQPVRLAVEDGCAWTYAGRMPEAARDSGIRALWGPGTAPETRKSPGAAIWLPTCSPGRRRPFTLWSSS